MSIAEQDQLRILDYLDGRLSTEQMVGFEIRLCNEPELASAFESFEAMDQLERRLALSRTRPARLQFLRGGLRLGTMAAAGLLILALGLWWAKDRGKVEPGRVAILTGGKDWIEFNRELGLTGEWLEVDPGSLRSGQRDGITHRDYFEHVAPLQEERLLQALRQAQRQAQRGDQERVEGEFFNLVLQPSEPCSAVVLLFDADGVVLDAEGRPFQVAFPGEPRWSAETGRLTAGQLAVLPGRNARWSEERLALEPFEPGFLIPQGTGKVHVLLALRSEAIDDALRTALMEVLVDLSEAEQDSRATAAALRSWLDGAGFDLRELEVFEREEP